MQHGCIDLLGIWVARGDDVTIRTVLSGLSDTMALEGSKVCMGNALISAAQHIERQAPGNSGRAQMERL